MKLLRAIHFCVALTLAAGCSTAASAQRTSRLNHILDTHFLEVISADDRSLRDSLRHLSDRHRAKYGEPLPFRVLFTSSDRTPQLIAPIPDIPGLEPTSALRDPTVHRTYCPLYAPIREHLRYLANLSQTRFSVDDGTIVFSR